MTDCKITPDLESLAKPFLDIGLYDSPTTFFRDVLRDMVTHKLDHYECIIEKFERKYSMDFSDFSKKLERGAAIKEEDDWMEWEAAINMRGAWKNTIRRV